MKNQQPKSKRGGSRGTTVILVLLLIIGLGIMAYPAVSNAWNSFFQSRAVASYADNIASMNQEEYDRILSEAKAYNARLAVAGPVWELDDARRADYESNLDLNGRGMMGYISIDRIGVLLPLMHGTDPDTLQTSVGHLEGTSLPVGAASWDEETGTVADPNDASHCVLSGHRGLPSARLFTDLDLLREGDVFTLTILNETLTYEIDQIRIVLPDDISELQQVRGEDLCTLVTCTPYGVNSHRLLVRGHRVPTEEEARELVIQAEAVRIPNYIMMLGVGIPMLLAFLVALLVRTRQRPALPTARELLERMEEGRTEEYAAAPASEPTSPSEKEENAP